MNDKMISTILLNLEKEIIKSYATAITESSTKQLESNISKYMNDSINLQRNIFNFMTSNNFYQVTKAKEEDIIKEVNNLTSKCQSL